MNYYDQKQIIARVDESGNVIGEIEKWEAHRKGVLHKALTIALIYDGKLVIQLRKHPAFDGVKDVTSSSHPLFIDGKLQSIEEATYDCLKREWNINRGEVKDLKDLGSVYYKAKDPKSDFTEHEVCEILIAEINKAPIPNLDYAYGFSIAAKEDLEKENNLAPWVKKMLEEDKI